MRFYTKWAEKVAVTTLHVGPFLLFRVKIRIITEDVRFTNKEMVNDVTKIAGSRLESPRKQNSILFLKEEIWRTG